MCKRVVLAMALIMCMFCGMTGCGGGSSANTPPSTDTAQSYDIADYKGQYKGTIDYRLTQYWASGVPIQLDLSDDGQLSNVIISGTATDTSAATVISSSGTEKDGTITGSGSFIVEGVRINVTYTGKVDAPTGHITITYRVSGGLSGTIVVDANRVAPVAKIATPAVITSYAPTNEFITAQVYSASTPSSLLSYKWELVSKPSGSMSAITDTNNAMVNFTPDIGGEYVLKLTVWTSKYSVASTTITLTANKRPVVTADIGSAKMGIAVVLDGSKTYDPEGSAVSYTWQFVSVPETTSMTFFGLPYLSNSTNSVASFTPTVDGIYKLSLQACDASNACSLSQFTIAVKPPYNNNGDGTFSDIVTNLMWQTDDVKVPVQYNGDADYWHPDACSSLNLGGHTDWRIPTLNEMARLRYDGTFMVLHYDYYYITSTISPFYGTNFYSAITYLTLGNDFYFDSYNHSSAYQDYLRVRCVRNM